MKRFALILFVTIVGCGGGKDDNKQGGNQNPPTREPTSDPAEQPATPGLSLASFDGAEEQYLYCALTRKSFDQDAGQCRDMTEIEKEMSGHYAGGAFRWTILGNVLIEHSDPTRINRLDLTPSEHVIGFKVLGNLRVVPITRPDEPVTTFELTYFNHEHLRTLKVKASHWDKILSGIEPNAEMRRFVPRFNPDRYEQELTRKHVQCAVLDKGYDSAADSCRKMTPAEEKISGLYVGISDGEKSNGMWVVGNTIVNPGELRSVMCVDFSADRDEDLLGLGHIVSGNVRVKGLTDPEYDHTTSFKHYTNGALGRLDLNFRPENARWDARPFGNVHIRVKQGFWDDLLPKI